MRMIEHDPINVLPLFPSINPHTCNCASYKPATKLESAISISIISSHLIASNHHALGIFHPTIINYSEPRKHHRHISAHPLSPMHHAHYLTMRRMHQLHPSTINGSHF